MTTYTDKELVKKAGRHINQSYPLSAFSTGAIYSNKPPGGLVGEFMFDEKVFTRIDARLLRDLSNGTADESVANAVEFIFGGDVEPHDAWATDDYGERATAKLVDDLGSVKLFEVSRITDELIDSDPYFKGADKLTVEFKGDLSIDPPFKAKIKSNPGMRSYGGFHRENGVESAEEALKAIGYDEVITLDN